MKTVTIIRASVRVVDNGQKTEPLSMKSGVRQGCSLSLSLFLVSLDWVMKTAFFGWYLVALHDILRRS